MNAATEGPALEPIVYRLAESYVYRKLEAKYGLKWGAPGGGFIYGASHSLAVGTKYENLMKMKECRDRYGVYPIRID